MRRVLREDLLRAMKSAYFWMAICVVFASCLIASGPNLFKTDQNAPDQSIIMEAITVDHALFRTEITYSSFMIFHSSLSGNLALFMPLIAALPFVPLYCDEKKSGFQRFAMYRTSKRKYYLAKIGGAVFSGMAAVAIGLLLMLAFCYFMFPPLSGYLPEYADYLEEMRPFLEHQYGSLCMVGSGLPSALFSILYAAMAAAAGAALSLLTASFSANKYIALGLPVLLYDIIGKIIYFSPYYETLTRFSPLGLLAPRSGEGNDILFFVCYVLTLVLLFSFLFYFNRMRRDRYGV